MKCCAFGTVRLDIRIYDELDKLGIHKEVKLDDIAMMLGGSVYYTASVLNEFDCDTVLYTLHIDDDFADFIRLRLSGQNINYIVSKRDSNPTAMTLVFVNGEGEKKMMSYDGKRHDSHILSKLLCDISQYDLFYTSFYEINQENYLQIAQIMELCPQNFLDLTPLLYDVDTEILETILNKTSILSGTAEEYDILTSKLQLMRTSSLMDRFGIKYVFEKRGKEGATLFSMQGNCSYKSTRGTASRDTTGCGDTFNAGVIYGISVELCDEDILKRAVNFATTVALDGFDLKNLRKKNS